MYVDIIISNIFNLNKYFFSFFSFHLWNDPGYHKLNMNQTSPNRTSQCVHTNDTQLTDIVAHYLA